MKRLVRHRPFIEAVREKLKDLNEFLIQEMQVDDGDIQSLTSQVLAGGGKRLRPALLFLVAEMGQNSMDKGIIPAAAVMELFHVASLYHDDVMDQAKLRRGSRSVNDQWGNSMACLGGTFLFARACEIMADLGLEANRETSKAASLLCLGQIQEMENAYNIDLTKEKHLEIITNKTAVLFSLPCKLGGLFSQADTEVLKKFHEFGNNLGIAFQLIDDVLDLTSSNHELGKKSNSDIHEGVYSMALLEYLNFSNREGAELRSLLLKKEISDEEMDFIKDLLYKSNAIDYSLQLATSYITKAKENLRGLEENNAKRSLENLCDYVIQRTN